MEIKYDYEEDILYLSKPGDFKESVSIGNVIMDISKDYSGDWFRDIRRFKGLGNFKRWVKRCFQSKPYYNPAERQFWSNLHNLLSKE